MRFEGRRVLITGASGGIGQAIVSAFLKEGAKTGSVFFRNDPKISNESNISLWADLRNMESAKEAVNRFIGAFGHIDILINGAAITANNFADKMSLEEWQSVLDSSLTSAFTITSCVLPHMKSRQSGRIINVGSIVGELGAIGCSGYVASKAALAGWTRALALENARHNILVNTLTLGYFNAGLGNTLTGKIREKITASIPLGKFGETDEIVRAIFYLSEVEYMTGASLKISGGM